MTTYDRWKTGRIQHDLEKEGRKKKPGPDTGRDGVLPRVDRKGNAQGDHRITRETRKMLNLSLRAQAGRRRRYDRKKHNVLPKFVAGSWTLLDAPHIPTFGSMVVSWFDTMDRNDIQDAKTLLDLDCYPSHSLLLDTLAEGNKWWPKP